MICRPAGPAQQCRARASTVPRTVACVQVASPWRGSRLVTARSVAHGWLAALIAFTVTELTVTVTVAAVPVIMM